MKPLYIFDLDGTLALIDHRRHFVEDKNNQDWDSFYKACVDDKPNQAIINIFNSLYLATDGYGEDLADIKIFSGRSDIVRKETEDWLETLTEYTEKCELKMRKHGDYTPDQILKKQWYEELPKSDKDRLQCVFDDRQKVVDMWRSLGITVCQVAEGKF